MQTEPAISPDIPFQIAPPRFDTASARASFTYRLGELQFVETLDLPKGFDGERANDPAFARLLDLTAILLGISYFKLSAPFGIEAAELGLTPAGEALIADAYENGLGEFYARNDLKRFGRLTLTVDNALPSPARTPMADRILLPIGGGKDSLVSVQLLEAAERNFTPFAVNPKGPILGSVEKIARPPLYVTRTLDAEMIRLSKVPGYYAGHVPATAINSMIASLVAVLFDYGTIILSNERSANEGNTQFDGREANHQYSKSLPFERLIRAALSEATGGTLDYFSLLRPYSEARIAALFARESRFDRVFSSCNRNFRLQGHDGPLWCGQCPKCHFTFLMLAPHMQKDRLLSIFGADLLDKKDNIAPYRELTGLAGQKPWECVGEILEAAACLNHLASDPTWANDAVVATLIPDLEAQYGPAKLDAAYADLMADTDAHLIPADLEREIGPHAL